MLPADKVKLISPQWNWYGWGQEGVGLISVILEQASFIFSFSLSWIGKDDAVSKTDRTSFAKIFRKVRGEAWSICVNCKEFHCGIWKIGKNVLSRWINNSKMYRVNVCIKNVSLWGFLRANSWDLNSQLTSEKNVGFNRFIDSITFYTNNVSDQSPCIFHDKMLRILSAEGQFKIQNKKFTPIKSYFLCVSLKGE